MHYFVTPLTPLPKGEKKMFYEEGNVFNMFVRPQGSTQRLLVNKGLYGENKQHDKAKYSQIFQQ